MERRKVLRVERKGHVYWGEEVFLKLQDQIEMPGRKYKLNDIASICIYRHC